MFIDRFDNGSKLLVDVEIKPPALLFDMLLKLNKQNKTNKREEVSSIFGKVNAK